MSGYYGVLFSKHGTVEGVFCFSQHRCHLSSLRRAHLESDRLTSHFEWDGERWVVRDARLAFHYCSNRLDKHTTCLKCEISVTMWFRMSESILIVRLTVGICKRQHPLAAVLIDKHITDPEVYFIYPDIQWMAAAFHIITSRLPVWASSPLGREGNALRYVAQMSIGRIEQMANRSPQDHLSSLCLPGWDCVRLWVFPLPSLCLFPLSTCPLDRHAPLFHPTKAAHSSVSAVFPAEVRGLRNPPSEWGLFSWSCAIGRGKGKKEGPSVDPLWSHRERQTWWISLLQRGWHREARASQQKSARLYLSLPLLFIHFRPHSVWFHLFESPRLLFSLSPDVLWQDPEFTRMFVEHAVALKRYRTSLARLPLLWRRECVAEGCCRVTRLRIRSLFDSTWTVWIVEIWSWGLCAVSSGFVFFTVDRNVSPQDMRFSSVAVAKTRAIWSLMKAISVFCLGSALTYVAALLEIIKDTSGKQQYSSMLCWVSRFGKMTGVPSVLMRIDWASAEWWAN